MDMPALEDWLASSRPFPEERFELKALIGRILRLEKELEEFQEAKKATGFKPLKRVRP